MAWVLDLCEYRDGDVRLIAQVLPVAQTLASGTVTETGSYCWRVRSEEPLGYSVEVRVNGQRLPRDVRSQTEVWFPWSPGFHAGVADLEVLGIPDRRALRVTVDPALAKLSRSEYRTMLRDIATDTRSLAATSGLKASFSRGKTTLPIAQLELILSRGQQLQELITKLDAIHRRRLVRRTSTVPVQAARRLTSRDWARSTRHAREFPATDVARLPMPLRGVVAAAGNRMPERVLQSNVLLDSARREHAEVLGMLEFVQTVLRRAVVQQGRLPVKQKDAVLYERCARMARSTRRLAQLQVFAGLSPLAGSWRPSRLYESVEPYRSLSRLNRDVRAGIGSVGGDFVNVPLRETFRLYETWVSLRLISAAKWIDPSLATVDMFRDDRETNRLTFSLIETDIEFTGRRLRFKPTFNEVWFSDDGIGSYSRQMIPDVVIEFLKPVGPATVVILDAKYRVETQLNDAIASIHTYRDALVEEDRLDGGSTPDRHLVTAGFVVVPRLPSNALQPAHWRSQSAPDVLFRRGYQSRYNFGAVQLKPGVGVPTVAELLRDLGRRFG